MFALVPLHSCGAGCVPRRPAVLAFVLGGAVVRAHTPCGSACAIVRRKKVTVPELGSGTARTVELGGAAVATEAYAVCARRTERRDVHVAEALGGAAEGSY